MKIVGTNFKRIQADAFQNDRYQSLANRLCNELSMSATKQSPECTMHKRQYQFVWAAYHKDQTKTFLICTDRKGKDKLSNNTFLEYLCGDELFNDGKFMRHFI